ncbi:antitoxin YezG family protein [Bacillus amyloliquefaciens]|nr:MULTISPECIES: immunity protein YezG family protein [Bacillus amyloliquefaciens group]USP43505.1 antitoxin YezG family protein [Bacillus amyloliquefaciens]
MGSNGQFQLDYNDDNILESELDGYQRIALWGSTKLLVFCLKMRTIKNF